LPNGYTSLAQPKQTAQNGTMDPRRLREATRPEHEATEAAMPLMEPGLTRERYTQVLSCLYPLVGGWDKWALAHAPESLRQLVAARQRHLLLHEDLRFLGKQQPPAPEFRIAAIPGLAAYLGLSAQTQGSDEQHGPFVACFLGAMYVMEGSTLGGQYIADHVEKSLGLQPGSGNAYFRGYGLRTGAMWKQFQAQLTELPDETGTYLIQAAKGMFRLFRESLENCG
jgi:heme oxygenase